MASEVAIACGLPDGFHPLRLDPPDPSPPGRDALRGLLAGLPPAPEGLAVDVLAGYERAVALLRAQQVLFCALGLHRDGGLLRSSVLALAARPLGAGPGPVLAGLLARVAADASAGGGCLLELPAGPALLWERRTAGTLWTGTVALACAAHDRLALLQLSCAVPERAADYREVLLGAAHTLALHRPAAAAAAAPGAEPGTVAPASGQAGAPLSRIADALG
ncbi:hypothetical protein GXW83_26900 [Streptacidiphilus sp. PB12-B1b]|uniref:hypothetical protein n=1 Tax=Streptacidiphilus sp. PB12-B1b TaxID=2705012 RepID=UPI0015FC32DB|nr:hypothetical protein [Streptacidiphilus sp. PB12-B1b]QMU78791.1 hypothetical protein GXW83_26900 [Streptacidiphilus sp. PB12-B1b]